MRLLPALLSLATLTLPPLAPGAAAQSPCGAWTEIPVPMDPSWSRADLEDVSVLPSGEAWAVGYARVPVPGGSEDVTLAMRYRDGAWTHTPTPYVAPYPGGANDTLHAVAAIASDDVWAAGMRYGNAGGLSVGSWIHVLHWDGTHWQEVSPPAPPGGVSINFSGTRVLDIVAFGPDDVWFGGQWGETNSMGSVTWRPLAMHWDGSSLTVHDTPTLHQVGPYVLMRQMVGIAPDDIWGFAERITGSTDSPAALHWDGSTWSGVLLPSTGTNVDIDDITATGPDDVWIFAHEPWTTNAFAYHWDGSGFTIVSGLPEIESATAVGPGEMYLGRGEVLHFDGTSAAPVAGLAPLASQNGATVLGMDSHDSCLNWAVGRKVGPTGELVPYAAAIAALPQGSVVCAWDEAGSPGCPCANSPAESGVGCANSLDRGAGLTANGTSLVADDAMVFRVRRARPHQPGMLVQGGSRVTVPFKDGILCVGNPTERLEVLQLDAEGAGASTVSVVTAGHVQPGDVRYYQVWYRDPGGVSPCGSASNFTQAIEVSWQ